MVLIPAQRAAADAAIGLGAENARTQTRKTAVACRFVRETQVSQGFRRAKTSARKNAENGGASFFLLSTLKSLTTLTKIENLPLPAVRVQRLNPGNPDSRSVAKLRRLRLRAAASALFKAPSFACRSNPAGKLRLRLRRLDLVQSLFLPSPDAPIRPAARPAPWQPAAAGDRARARGGSRREWRRWLYMITIRRRCPPHRCFRPRPRTRQRGATAMHSAALRTKVLEIARNWRKMTGCG